MKSSVVVMGVIVASLVAAVAVASEGERFMDGEFWREQALTQIIPYWFQHARDEEYGAFHTSLSRQWQPSPPWDKYPAMIGRQLFSFSAAYLLSGEERYLEVARETADYLLEHAWDEEYGGWFDVLTRTGEPKVTTKTAPLELYANAGLALYYLVTGDERALSHVQESLRIRRTYAHDEEFGGYFQAFNRDLSVKDYSKSKHSHYGQVGSLLLNLYMITREPELLTWMKELMDLTATRMLDPRLGWVYVALDREWNPVPHVIEGREVVSIGPQLVAVVSFLRLYQLTGDRTYLEHGKALGEQTIRWGWDSDRGGWHVSIGKEPPHRPEEPPMVHWWIQNYGSFLFLQLYHLTQDNSYLDQFRKGTAFWNRYFLDREFGGVFMSVSPEGSLIDERKAGVWRTSYHEMEHALLNYLYLNLYVNNRPVLLHFRIGSSEPLAKHFVSPVEDSSVQIADVKINDKPWPAYNARERYVILPAGEDLKVEVTLAPWVVSHPTWLAPERVLGPHVSDCTVPLLSAIAGEDTLSFKVTPTELRGKIEAYLPWRSFSVEVDGRLRAVAREGKMETEEFAYDPETRMLSITVPPRKEGGVLRTMSFCIREGK